MYIVTRLNRERATVAEYACSRQSTALELAAQILNMDSPRNLDYCLYRTGIQEIRNYFNPQELMGTRPDVLITDARRPL